MAGDERNATVTSDTAVVAAINMERNNVEKIRASAEKEDGELHHSSPPSVDLANSSSLSNKSKDASPSSKSSLTDVPDTSSPSSPPVPEAIPPPEPEAGRSKLETVIILASLCSAVFLAALDVTIITTALPTISEYFQSSSGYTWIGSAYLLANAASVPSWGKISDIWGRRPIILAAAGVFFVGSLLAGVSVSIEMLIVARAIQGIGAGGLIILSNICISDLFSMRNRGKYFGIIGMVWAFASGFGPVLGGVFTEKVSWRWCFYINLPITGTVFVFLFFFLKLQTPKTPVWDGLKAVDWLGSLTIVTGTLMLLLGLQFGGVTYPWTSPTVICLIIFGLVVATLFFLNEWKLARYPVMPLRLFRHRSNIAALATCFCHGFVFIAGSYYLPLYFQAILGATPLLSGVYLMPFVLALSLSSGATGVFIKKTGKYLPAIWFGFTFTTLGFGLLIDLDATTNWPKIIIFQILAGIGVGPNFQSPLLALQSKVTGRDIATATATFGFVRNLSTTIGVVIGGVVFQNQMVQKADVLIAALGPQLAAALGGSSAGASVGIVKTLPPAQQVIVRQAFFESLRTMWIVFTAFAGLGFLISLTIGNQKLSKEHEVTKTGLVAEEENRRQEMERKRLAKGKKDEEKAGKSEEKREEKIEEKSEEKVVEVA